VQQPEGVAESASTGISRTELVTALRAAVRAPMLRAVPPASNAAATSSFHDPGTARNIVIALLGRMQAAAA
jgi:hypothetical protein